MSNGKSDLDEVYSAGSVGDIRNIYENWANEYDRDNLEKGYRLPGIAAAFTSRFLKHKDEAIYDAGCGTGLVGEALSIMGFRDIVGSDLSPQMVEIAKSRGVYSKLCVQELGQPVPEIANHFSAVTCFGSFGPGHAPPHSLDELIRIVKPGGHIVFNVRDDTYDEQGFKSKMSELSEVGVWRCVDQSEIFRPFLISEPEITVLVFVYEIL